MLTLYTYWRSSASHRVRLALGFKGLAYEPVFVNLLKSEQRTAEYKAKNPIGHLPALVMDGVTYIESTAILELLEDLHPSPSLYPPDPHDRARVRALMQFVNSGIQPLHNLVVLDRVGDDKDKRLDWIHHFMVRGLIAWETLATSYRADGFVKRGPFAYGEQFGAADILLLAQLYGARRFGVDLEPYPLIRGVEESTKDLPFVKAAHPDAQPDAAP